MAASVNPPGLSVYQWTGTNAWQLTEVAIAARYRIYLWGPPGVGKSYIAHCAARVCRHHAERRHHGAGTDGHYIPQDTCSAGTTGRSRGRRARVPCSS
jgi:hypothetical protein